MRNVALRALKMPNTHRLELPRRFTPTLTDVVIVHVAGPDVRHNIGGWPSVGFRERWQWRSPPAAANRERDCPRLEPSQQMQRATKQMEKPSPIASIRPREPGSVIDRNSTTDLMLASVPSLRAFAISLCGKVDRADDLVQAALLQALAHIDSFEPGSMIAWLITILRNIYRSEHRKRWREVEDSDGSHAATLTSQPDQASGLEFREFLAALGTLPPEQREALILVGASGLSYEEAAEICGCAIGTVKSRIHRARARLCELLPSRGEETRIRRRSQLQHAQDDRALGHDIASKCEARNAHGGADSSTVARKAPPNVYTPPPRRWRPVVSAGTSAPDLQFHSRRRNGPAGPFPLHISHHQSQ